MDMKEDTLEIGKILVSTLFSKFCKITNNLTLLYLSENVQNITCLQTTSLRHVILIIFLTRPVSALTPKCFMFSGEVINTNCIVFCLTRPELETMIYR